MTREPLYHAKFTISERPLLKRGVSILRKDWEAFGRACEKLGFSKSGMIRCMILDFLRKEQGDE